MKYNHTEIEKKWQERWEKENLYVADIENGKNPFYNLWMFPYPSAEGLHAGHAFASTGSDIYGRYMRMQGKEVLQPIGYDSFGIHSENYAIKIGETPQLMLGRTTKHYEAQLRSLGHGYDWTRTVSTAESEYYKWTQWLFTEMFKSGLAYKKKATVNFCPSCKTVLADEQVMTPAQAGKEPKDAKGNIVEKTLDTKVCERCGTVVEKKDLDQWFMRITDYSERLLKGLDSIDWSQRVRLAQREWIGKSEGMIIKFDTEDGKSIEVFTTRPDTLNAVTFLATSKLYEEGSKEKTGRFSGKYALSPIDGRKLPIWDTNYVAPNYGTGIVMGVPAHDERDMEFAKKYDLDIVNKEPEESLWSEIEKNEWGKRHTNYHLRDWLVSRQRYWGAPIPMIYCQKCKESKEGYLALNKSELHKDHSDWDHFGWWPEENLPVALPEMKEYKPAGEGKGPLALHPEFYEVKCPHCGGSATRETDVMDTFVDSSWYFLRYPSVKAKTSNKLPFDPVISKKWLPVSLYFGGAEHAVLHLMYSRFVNMVMYDKKLVDSAEPFPKFFAHGLMIKDGAKMSKSRGNVVNPDEYVKKFGADALRLYLAFMGPMDSSPDFRDSGIEGSFRFIQRLWKIFTKKPLEEGNTEVKTKLNQTIEGVGEDIKQYKYNTAIAKIMELTNVIYDNGAEQNDLKTLALLLAPFTPHLAEEVWVEVLNQPFSIHKSSWPKSDPKYLKVDQITIVVQVNGKLRSQITIDNKISGNKEEIVKLALKDKKVEKWISGKIKKEIFVPGRLVNFVV